MTSDNRELGFKGGNASNVHDNHQERKRYKTYMEELGKVYSIRDTLYKDKHYGFLNKEHQVIQPISGIDTVNFGSYAPDVFGLNYVVDQFVEFRDFYKEFSLRTGLNPPDLVANLSPGKSFSNFDDLHQDSLKSYALKITDPLQQIIINPSIGRMLNPLEFYQHFSEKILFLPRLRDHQLSKSGYALSFNSSCYETGLYVDLAENISTDLDYEKGKMLEHSGFLCYLKFANMYGFSIDFNAPWRLVIDLEHDKTQENILNGRRREDFWDFYYDQYVEKVGYSYDYYNIREFYESLYKTYYRMYNGLTIRDMDRISWRQIYSGLFSSSLLSTSYGPGNFWIETFLLNRLKEIGFITSYPEFLESSRAADILNQALLIYGPEIENISGSKIENPISTDTVGRVSTGVEAFITDECSKILKEKSNQIEY